jgi:hypothetical protein
LLAIWGFDLMSHWITFGKYGYNVNFAALVLGVEPSQLLEKLKR